MLKFEESRHIRSLRPPLAHAELPNANVLALIIAPQRRSTPIQVARHACLLDSQASGLYTHKGAQASPNKIFSAESHTLR